MNLLVYYQYYVNIMLLMINHVIIYEWGKFL
jgi:hypothetical protein